MTRKVNTIEGSNAVTFEQTSEIASESFLKMFRVYVSAFYRRLGIEKARQAKAFSAESFWADNTMSDEIIASAHRKPKLNSKGEPVLSKGKPVFINSRFNKRASESAASIIRRGCRSQSALKALARRAGTYEAAVNESDKLGSILNLIRPLSACGLCTNNEAASDAKNAAIKAFTGETATSSAKRALLGSLYGKEVTSEEAKRVIEAQQTWSNEASEARLNSQPEPKPLTWKAALAVLKLAKPEAEKGSAKGKKAGSRKPRASRKAQPVLVSVSSANDPLKIETQPEAKPSEPLSIAV